jgi:8-oxo-dGTP pyrophosphatase MutT (NUDIX family)
MVRARIVEQAGAIVVRRRQGVPHVLLITAKKNRGHWLFPKGHVDDGETREEAALREAEEEAGVRARLVGPAGIHTFNFGHETIRVHYFLATTDDKGHPEKGRQLAWFSYREALAQLTFPDTRALLKEAWASVPRP